jgi:lipopolysaccharide transport system ATP-binding protein
MIDKVAIKVDNVSKKYCKSLKRSMFYGIQDILRNTLGLSSHSNILRKGEFWALHDILLEVKKGETIGIIGPNGAGKTTLLKLLNGIFWPDEGKITINGKVGALIAVGAGFHPLLTGRENIYINAAILGMTKKEVDKKFDDIIEFADIGDFIDSPVKYYSSGMFVRLGFAIAVHCDPEVLLVDEVLAVGDIEFQNKCFNKIGELMSKGMTVILVSHNIFSIRRICNKCLWLDRGKIRKYGDTLSVTDAYQNWILEKEKKVMSLSDKDECLKIENVYFKDQDKVERTTFGPDETVSCVIIVNPEENIENPTMELRLKSLKGIEILHTIEHLNTSFKANSQEYIEFWIERLPLMNDIVYFNILLWNHDMTKLYARRSGVYSLRIISTEHLRGQISVKYKTRLLKNVKGCDKKDTKII